MKKIFISILCFCVLLSCFAVSSFAAANEGYVTQGETYLFKEVLEPDLFVSAEGLSFTSNGLGFGDISFYYSNGLVGYYDDLLVYDEGWVDESYRSITFDSTQTVPYYLQVFLTANEQTSSIYDNIFDIVKDAIYGSRNITDNENFVLVLIATCFSVLAVALPFIVIFMLLKFFVGTIARY